MSEEKTTMRIIFIAGLIALLAGFFCLKPYFNHREKALVLDMDQPQKVTIVEENAGKHGKDREYFMYQSDLVVQTKDNQKYTVPFLYTRASKFPDINDSVWICQNSEGNIVQFKLDFIFFFGVFMTFMGSMIMVGFLTNSVRLVNTKRRFKDNDQLEQ